MNDPEIEYLRKSLDELRQQLAERDAKIQRELGYAEAWRERVEAQLARVETRLENLLFSLSGAWPRTRTADTPPAAPEPPHTAGPMPAVPA